MAIYHFSAKIVSRAQGQSVVAAAAYRAGERIKEARTGTIYDFTRKEAVDHVEVLAPEDAPAWARDRAQLWNAVDAFEKRKDAQLARNIEMALPVELGSAAQVSLVRDFAQRHFVSRGMAVDVAIHHDNPTIPTPTCC